MGYGSRHLPLKDHAQNRARREPIPDIIGGARRTPLRRSESTLALPRAVTAVWRTGPGTTLLKGMKATTDDTAYFAPPPLAPGYREPSGRSKSLSGLVPPTRAPRFL